MTILYCPIFVGFYYAWAAHKGTPTVCSQQMSCLELSQVKSFKSIVIVPFPTK